MEIAFDVGGSPVRLQRDWFLGGMKLVTPDRTIDLQSPRDLGTHLSLSLQQSWQENIAGHAVRIEKQRPLMFAGLRPQTFRVFVDGVLVAERNGY